MGIDVALEEINHLLEVDLSNSNRNIFKGKNKITMYAWHFLSVFS